MDNNQGENKHNNVADDEVDLFVADNVGGNEVSRNQLEEFHRLPSAQPPLIPAQLQDISVDLPNNNRPGVVVRLPYLLRNPLLDQGPHLRQRPVAPPVNSLPVLLVDAKALNMGRNGFTCYYCHRHGHRRFQCRKKANDEAAGIFQATRASNTPPRNQNFFPSQPYRVADAPQHNYVVAHRQPQYGQQYAGPQMNQRLQLHDPQRQPYKPQNCLANQPSIGNQQRFQQQPQLFFMQPDPNDVRTRETNKPRVASSPGFK